MTLADLIASDPDNAARSDAEVLAWLRELVQDFVNVDWQTFYEWRHVEGITSTQLQTAAAGTGATATAAQYFLDLTAAGQELATSRPAVRTLIMESDLPAAKRATLQALATVSVPRWRQAGVSFEPNLGDVEQVRAG